MNLLALRVIKNKGGNETPYFSSKPMVSTIDEKNNLYISQYLRDIDLGIDVYEGETISIEILAYKSKLNYNNVFTLDNRSNLIYNSSNAKSIGIYNILINIQDKEIVFGLKKGFVKKILDENNNLSISFRAIYYDNIKSYVISNPTIQCNLNYLKY